MVGRADCFSGLFALPTETITEKSGQIHPPWGSLKRWKRYLCSMKTTLLFTFLFFFATATFAEGDASALFRQGNAAYQKNDFGLAVKSYQAALQAGYESAELHYNLGNAFFRLDKTGKAILHYERALLLDPGDADTKHNLAVANAKLQDAFEPLPDFFLTRWWNGTRMAFSATAWGILTLLLWWGGFSGYCLWQLGESRASKKKGFTLGALCLFLSLLPFGLALSRANYDGNTNYAIILQNTASLRSAPDEAGAEVFQLHEGSKVRLLDRLQDWYRVRLPNGEEGWLKSGDFEEI